MSFIAKLESVAAAYRQQNHQLILEYERTGLGGEPLTAGLFRDLVLSCEGRVDPKFLLRLAELEFPR